MEIGSIIKTAINLRYCDAPLVTNDGRIINQPYKNLYAGITDSRTYVWTDVWRGSRGVIVDGGYGSSVGYLISLDDFPGLTFGTIPRWLEIISPLELLAEEGV